MLTDWYYQRCRDRDREGRGEELRASKRMERHSCSGLLR